MRLEQAKAFSVKTPYFVASFIFYAANTKRRITDAERT